MQKQLLLGVQENEVLQDGQMDMPMILSMAKIHTPYPTFTIRCSQLYHRIEYLYDR